MKIVLLEEAQPRFEVEDAWWRANRDAQELFFEEFSAVLGQIGSMPEIASATVKVAGGWSSAC